MVVTCTRRSNCRSVLPSTITKWQVGIPGAAGASCCGNLRRRTPLGRHHRNKGTATGWRTRRKNNSQRQPLTRGQPTYMTQVLHHPRPQPRATHTCTLAPSTYCSAHALPGQSAEPYHTAWDFQQFQAHTDAAHVLETRRLAHAHAPSLPHTQGQDLSFTPGTTPTPTP